MSKTRVKINKKGFQELRSAPGVRAELEKIANSIAAAAGDGYETSSQQGAKRPYGRWRTTVITANGKAVRDNAKNNTLLRQLESRRRG